MNKISGSRLTGTIYVYITMGYYIFNYKKTHTGAQFIGMDCMFLYVWIYIYYTYIYRCQHNGSVGSNMSGDSNAPVRIHGMLEL